MGRAAPRPLPVSRVPCDAGGSLSMQINGVDMTEARHDQAVALLTGTSPTITLLVERELASSPAGSPALGRARAHSPPPPEPNQPAEPADGRANHLEDEYPIEVRGPGWVSVRRGGEGTVWVGQSFLYPHRVWNV